MEKKIIADEMRHLMEAVITLALSVVLGRRRLLQKQVGVIPEKRTVIPLSPENHSHYSSNTKAGVLNDSTILALRKLKQIKDWELHFSNVQDCQGCFTCN